MLSQSIIEVVRRYLAKVEEIGIPVARAVIYGSFACGKQTENSDIDLLVLSPIFDKAKNTQVVDQLWRMTWRVDSRIEPIAVGVREFEESEDSPLIAIARQEGVTIYAARPGTKTARVAEGKTRYGTRSRRKPQGAGS
jgi:predicted nucleotidyltransferase